MSAVVDRLRQDRGALEEELHRAGAEFSSGKNSIRCPFHPHDNRPSGSIFQGDDGAWRYKCFTCDFQPMDVWDVMACNQARDVAEIMADAARRDETPAIRPATAAAKPKTPPRRYADVQAVIESFGERYKAHYAYTDPDTRRIDLLVVRTIDKMFFQFHQDAPDGEIISGGCPDPQPIYNRARIRRADVVVIVEGERDVHTLHDFGIIATTAPMGADKSGEKAKHADWSPLAGKRVILWPDHDAAGLAHADAVERELSKLNTPASLSRIDPADLSLGEKEDASDFIEQMRTAGMSHDEIKAALVGALDMARPVGPAADLRRQLEDIAAGRRRPVHFHHYLASHLTQCLLPGAITIFCGAPGASKTLWVQEAAMTLHEAGVAVAIFHLEEDRTFHLRRALAQLAEKADITNEEWAAAHGAEVLALAGEFEQRISSFGARITDCPEQGATYDVVVEWAERRAGEGARVLVIDPITLADPGRQKPWEADRAIMARLKAVAVRRGCSIVLVSHPSKGGKDGGFLDRLAGGAAFQRAAQTVLWLEHLPEVRADLLVRAHGQVFKPQPDRPVNRILHIAKARNGRGTGAKIGYFFDPESLRHHELGIVEERKKQR